MIKNKKKCKIFLENFSERGRERASHFIELNNARRNGRNSVSTFP